MRKHSPYKHSILLWALLTGIAFALLTKCTLASPLISIIASFNLSAFVLYGLDKFFAINKMRRVPEYILYLAAFTGGAAGALLGMYLFRHKVSKTSFQFGLAAVILIEIAIILQYTA